MLSATAKRNISRIIPYAFIWLIFSLVYTLLEKGLLDPLDYYPSTGNPYNSARNFFVTPLAALLTGFLIGAMEVFYFNRWFMKRSFGQKILYKSLIYFILILFFLLLLTVFANIFELKTSFLDKVIWRNTWLFLTNYSFVSVAVYMATIIFITQFYAEVSENMGQAVLSHFFTGKYHQPTEEERIFMFLDMKSSTTIAERLGHVKYFEMLSAYYADISNPVIQYAGEIYQYVGDEMVVSWKLEKGLKDNNCLQCFFAMKTALEQQADKYQGKFGVCPGFKAGFHYGKVTTGEIGIIKKDIIFTGDVLNTTARIQSLCKSYDVDLLISGELLQRLSIKPPFAIRNLGETALRGREEKVQLYTIYRQ